MWQVFDYVFPTSISQPEIRVRIDVHLVEGRGVLKISHEIVPVVERTVVVENKPTRDRISGRKSAIVFKELVDPVSCPRLVCGGSQTTTMNLSRPEPPTQLAPTQPPSPGAQQVLRPVVPAPAVRLTPVRTPAPGFDPVSRPHFFGTCELNWRCTYAAL